jgi:hypothetical protein
MYSHAARKRLTSLSATLPAITNWRREPCRTDQCARDARSDEDAERIDLVLKIHQLRQSRSTDRLQQLQSQAIVELYDVVKQIQEAIWPMLLTIPDVSGAREAAQHTVATRSDAISMSTLGITK